MTSKTNRLFLKVYCMTTDIYLTDLIPEDAAMLVMLNNEELYPRLNYELHDANGIAVDYEE